MKEEWRDIKGYEDLYQVSNMGGVRSLDRVVAHKRTGTYTLKGRILKPSVDRKGYIYVVLYKDTKRKHQKLHRLIAKSFISNPENKPCVCHKNYTPNDNRIENLFWGTWQDNMTDKMRKGRHRTGIHSKTTEIYCLETGEVYKSLREAGRQLNIHAGSISKVLKKQRAHTGGYSFQYVV